VTTTTTSPYQAGSNAAGAGWQDALREIPDHQNQPRAAESELFAPPPAEIGQVLSAESNLKAGKREKSFFARMTMVCLIAGVPAFVLAWIAENQRPNDRFVLNVIAAITAIVLAAATWFMTRFKRRCSYVGQDGVALFELRGSRESQPTLQLLRFADAAGLKAAQTRHFYNGVYTGTTYDFRWTDAVGNRIFKLAGKYNGKDKPPKKGDPFHFAFASDVAWSTHYLARAQAQLEAEGSIAFPVDSKRVVRVGPGFMEFHFGGEPVRITPDEIAKVNLGGGQFSFKHKDAKWYSSAGKFSFAYGQMANGKVFLLALEKLMGYRWN
jgi:hypothetical protein